MIDAYRKRVALSTRLLAFLSSIPIQTACIGYFSTIAASVLPHQFHGRFNSVLAMVLIELTCYERHVHPLTEHLIPPFYRVSWESDDKCIRNASPVVQR